jgi:hypothetical protein
MAPIPARWPTDSAPALTALPSSRTMPMAAHASGCRGVCFRSSAPNGAEMLIHG